MNLKQPIEIVDTSPKTGNILKEVLVGLSKSHKSIDSKFLYDKRGSEIFEEICKLTEYYPTRVENKILSDNATEIATLIGSDALIIEPGSGSSQKIKALLRKLERPKGYVPIEISRDILVHTAEELMEEFPQLKIIPICADFTQDLEFPISLDTQRGRKVFFFPGSTIGNMHPTDAVAFLKKIGKTISSGGALLVGVDLKKDKEIFKRAYNDSLGVTAAFNLNLLERLNRELDASFSLDNFEHEAFYNEELGRVEMHLKSKIPQLVRVNQTVFRFRKGETIHTESSYKYSQEEFCELAARAKLEIRKIWTDQNKMFSIYYFEKE